MSPPLRARAEDFFLLRAPLRAVAELEAWRDAAHARAAGDDAAYARFLARWLDDPIVADAMALASPDLLKELERESPPRRATVLSLLKYVARSCTRPTPFGLFAGYAVGRVSTTDLRIGGVEALHVYPAGALLWSLADVARQELAGSGRLRYVPNPSLYEAAGRLHYIERQTSDDQVTYHLAATHKTEALQTVVDASAGGATRGELMSAVAQRLGVGLDEAAAYVDAVTAGQVLMPDVDPPAVPRDLFGELRALYIGAPGTMAIVDAIEHGCASAALREAPFRALGQALLVATGRTSGSALHVQARVAAEPLTLGPEVVRDVLKGAGILHSIFGAGVDRLGDFRRAFTVRYGRREVPLMDVVDPHVGLGYPPPRVSEETRPGTALYRPERDQVLGLLMQEALQHRSTSIALTPDLLDRLRRPDVLPLPDTFSVLFAVARNDAGRLEVVLRVAGGPPSTRLMGRFAVADDELTALLRRCSSVEEQATPDVIVAEIVHMPNGAVGNIVQRPPLHAYEIPFLARGSVDEPYRIPPQDLTIALVGEHFRLRSLRLGREVVPRLTSAHNHFRSDNLGLYQLLAALQVQRTSAAVSWNWGSLARLPFLPRVTFQNLVFTRARWLVTADELRRWSTAGTDAERMERIGAWREEWRVPRWVTVGDLVLDLDNQDCLEMLPPLLAADSEHTIAEAWPDPEHTAVSGPGGGYLHEFDLPFRNLDAVRVTRIPPRIDVAAAVPGGEWLHALLFCNEKSADDVLGALHKEVVVPSLDEGAAQSWFFVRYGDPQWHIRLRLRGRPTALHGSALARLHATACELVARGIVWRMQLDTYVPEVERYGGPEGLLLCEEWFRHDSDSAMRLLAGGAVPEDSRERLLFALGSVDRLLRLFDFDAARFLAVLRSASRSFRAAVPNDRQLREQLAQQFRDERDVVESLLNGDATSWPWVDELVAEHDRRASLMQPIASALASREREGTLVTPLDSIVIALLHMNTNRLLAESHRTSEVLMYDLLERTYAGRVARGVACR